MTVSAGVGSGTGVGLGVGLLDGVRVGAGVTTGATVGTGVASGAGVVVTITVTRIMNGVCVAGSDGMIPLVSSQLRNKGRTSRNSSPNRPTRDPLFARSFPIVVVQSPAATCIQGKETQQWERRGDRLHAPLTPCLRGDVSLRYLRLRSEPSALRASARRLALSAMKGQVSACSAAQSICAVNAILFNMPPLP
jgi:hypothetical protein